jgi:hypothetical protein
VPRTITHRYEDPLDAIWIACARDIGLTIARSDEVYASFDGKKTLTLCSDASFDPDDSLAQMIFHELCHGLVADKKNAKKEDWGLSNTDERDLVLEHACHRVQAALADQYGLRALFAVTTEWRPYWDALPIDPLRVGEDDPAIARARAAFERALSGPWSLAIQSALMRTAQLAAVLRDAGMAPDSLWALTKPMHRSGFPLGEREDTCASCAWSATWTSKRRKVTRCRQAEARDAGLGNAVDPEAVAERVIAPSDRACVRFEPRLTDESCASCGACCRQGFDRVELREREVVKRRHLELVSSDSFGEFLARPLGLCVALTQSEAGYRCTIYRDRPRACAEFEVGGDACLSARRRVGLSA